jgi:hypothetical protein
MSDYGAAVVSIVPISTAYGGSDILTCSCFLVSCLAVDVAKFYYYYYY